MLSRIKENSIWLRYKWYIIIGILIFLFAISNATTMKYTENKTTQVFNKMLTEKSLELEEQIKDLNKEKDRLRVEARAYQRKYDSIKEDISSINTTNLQGTELEKYFIDNGFTPVRCSGTS
jgi:uncharacterized protein YlxW (UPF0749 family)